MRSIDGGSLSESECRALLATKSVGWMALSIEALPAVVPVRYHYDGEIIAACLGSRALPRESFDRAVVALSAGEIDTDASHGWTVHVLGIIEAPTAPGVPATCGPPGYGQIVYLRPANITGEQLQFCPGFRTD